MAYPFAPWPTLREFIDAAEKQGCKEIAVTGIIGTKGPLQGRCLVGPNGVPYPLPGIKDLDRISPTLVGSIERALKIQTGYGSV
jgi:hypothetical protein